MYEVCIKLVMELPEYISEIGDEAAARLFQVATRTVQSWRLRSRAPRPNKAKEIARLTKNKVSVEECYGSHGDS